MPPREYYLPHRQLVAQNEAELIEAANIPRSKFINSWTHKTTFDAGYLVPFMVEEIYPGDHMTYDVTTFIRMSTLLFPQFDSQQVDTFFFFVPYRLLWTHWVNMMGEQTNPGDTIAYNVPRLTVPVGGQTGTLADHFGIPVGNITNPLLVNALPFRAYNQIWNQWFRDENLMASQPIDTGDGPDNYTDYALLKRAKQHDYFTSCLPWPQKFTGPTMSFTGFTPVTGLATLGNGALAPVANLYDTALGGPITYPDAITENQPAGAHLYAETDGTGKPQIFADFNAPTSSAGFTINAFRQAFMIQALVERDARGGTRYIELVRAHFGVVNPDFRLQRPEYIGGGRSPLMVTPVAQTTATGLANLGGTGTGAGRHHASYAATEHGVILGLINIRTDISYQQGLDKLWGRLTRYDFYWPALAQLGEQTVTQGEVYTTGTPATDALVFGYQERWHELRTRWSLVTGQFNSNAAGGPLDAWHLAQNFSGVPGLNSTFLSDSPPVPRAIAAGNTATGFNYLASILINRVAVRPLPAYGTPALLGRF